MMLGTQLASTSVCGMRGLANAEARAQEGCCLAQDPEQIGDGFKPGGAGSSRCHVPHRLYTVMLLNKQLLKRLHAHPSSLPSGSVWMADSWIIYH